ncbi:site-specific DNA-methyltransferase [Faecalicoccus pleomorphus]|uniref:Methyltransferase n=1 Tax=Faecalicoccus pleomorphus TaxID=1323 RepID=A0A3E3E581_9FIRM|nr:site-specific DNA-methyltransferase [Faecalicoccus pleomorphus]RGD76374.1 site-specific DNA-methyltransferase [Faecalicoccus pleomorphus]
MKVLNQVIKERYALYNGDSAEVMQGLPSDSMDYSIFSPPFESLYTYSDSDRDLGNCRNEEEFYQQFDFIAKELYRIIKPGRLISVHCMDLPASLNNDGFIGLKDFPGKLIKVFEKVGFIYHSRVTIWKDPVVAMQRTKALGLLHKQIKKDSSMCRQGIADYIITLRKPGENKERISHTNETFLVEKWQQYASPVWMDINQSNTLNRKSARDERDEKHICPLQLDVIERCIELWTNEGDTVFTPFLGIGSEAYQALKMNRNAVGIELKESYFEQAVKNCENALTSPVQLSLFDVGEVE